MDRDFENDFEVLFENNATTNYLVLRAKGNINILNYQVQMLLNNKIKGLLEFNTNYVGGELNCFYNVTSKCTLASFMSRKKFTRDEFLIMLLNIMNNICHIKNYLLYDYNILLDERYIYVQPEKMEVFFVYLPFNRSKNDYKAFLLKLVVEMARFCTEDSDNYLQRILEFIKNDLFSLGTLKTQLEILLGSDIKSMGVDKKHEKIVARENSEKSAKEPIRCIDTKSKSLKIPGANMHGIDTERKRHSNEKDNNRQNTSQTKKPHKIILKPTGAKSLPALGFILFQPALLILYILTVTGSFGDAGQNRLETAIIALVIFACIDVLVFRLIRDKLKTGKGESVETADKLDKDARVVDFISAKMRAGSQEQQVIFAEQENMKNQIPAPRTVYHGETEIIRKPKIKAKAYLKELDGDTVIELDKKSILVGRMEGLVDTVLKSSAVGKIHAELLFEEGDYYIVDCNSINGTFINNKRLLPNSKIKIQHNDTVRFANKEFRFFSSVLPGEALA